MRQYLDLLDHIMENGVDRNDRTGTGTKSIFGYQMRFDLSQGFPLLTTKKVFLKGIIYELLRFLSGETNIKYLVDNNVHIRDERPYEKYIIKQSVYKNKKPILEKKEFIKKIKEDLDFAQKWGNLGPVYGYQRRNFNGEHVDQIQKVIDTIKNNPNSRRILVISYNPIQIENMTLPPCHMMFQFYVANGKLSCQMYQRSADVFLGVPFNIASYSLLLMMMAQITGLEAGEFIHSFGDTHIYHNHYNQVKEQLSRTPKELPVMKLNKNVKNLFDFKYEDFVLENYNPYPIIKAPISV